MQKKYLALLHKIGLTHKNLFEIFPNGNGDFEKYFLELDYEKLKKIKISGNRISQILKYKNEINKEKIFQKINELDIKIITFFDEDYPENLKNIFNPPFLLYVRGDISGNFFAFVGSRNISSYGKKLLEDFIPKVGKYFGIISGGALGCDSYAHKMAIDNDIKTIAVFGTGIDIFYPTVNENLFENILKKGGALVSIFPISEPGNPYNFPVRNEIVAGWSKGVYIAEAKTKSGSLITANLALDLGKDLFTTPGDIYKISSSGCNELLHSASAKMVLKAEDILSEYNINPKKSSENKKQIIFNDETEKEIYDLLLTEAFFLDEISEKLNLDISTTSLKITFMELAGVLKKAENGKYEII